MIITSVCMRKISITAVYRASMNALSILLLIAFCAANAFAKNNCENNAALVNPALVANSGIGGTGISAAQSGIGGTGLHDDSTAQSENAGSGIGGTGIVVDKGGIGGTGIIGVITGFASICVNGIEVHYDDRTPISVDGRASNIRELAIGQLVAVRAKGTGQELTADNIAIIHATVGPISSLDLEAGEMLVLGQTVYIGTNSTDEQLALLQAGDWVRVSGHRLTNGAIVASRIESTQPLDEAHINGRVSQVDDQGFVINGTQVRYVADSRLFDVSQGAEVQAVGYWDGTYLHAQQVLIEPVNHSLGNVAHVVIEGYVHNRDNRELNLNNRIVVFDANANIAGSAMDDFRVDQRVQISGRVGTDHRITPERVEVVNAASAPAFERIDRDFIDNGGKIEMKKEVDQGTDDKPAVDGDIKRDDKLDMPDTPAMSDSNLLDQANDHHDLVRNIDKPDLLDTPTMSDSNLLDRMDDHRDLVRDIDNHRDYQRDFELPDHVRDFDGHHDRLFLDR